MSYLANHKSALSIMEALVKAGLAPSAFGRNPDSMEFLPEFPEDGSEVVFDIQPNKRVEIEVAVHGDTVQVHFFWQTKEGKLKGQNIICDVASACGKITAHKSLA
jgi:hypothetical protein